MSNPGSLIEDARLHAIADAVWLADLDTAAKWSTYECGHGATYKDKCPARCAAHRRMVRLHLALYGATA